VSLKAGGLPGVHLVISDAHAALKVTVAQQFTGSSWQRRGLSILKLRVSGPSPASFGGSGSGLSVDALAAADVEDLAGDRGRCLADEESSGVCDVVR